MSEEFITSLSEEELIINLQKRIKAVLRTKSEFRLLQFLEELEDDYAVYLDQGYSNPNFEEYFHESIDELERIKYEFARYQTRIFEFQDDETEIKPVLSNIYSAIIEHITQNPEVMDTLTSRQFEEMIAEILFKSGWEVELTPETRDGGYDILAIAKNIGGTGLRTSCIIECKKNRPDRKVGVGVVRQLLYVKNDLKVPSAIIASTSDFTSGVEKMRNERYDLDLKNRQAIIAWCDEYMKRKRG